MSLWHQVCPVLCIVYCIPGIRSVVYWVLGRYALDSISRVGLGLLFPKYYLSYFCINSLRVDPLFHEILLTDWNYWTPSGVFVLVDQQSLLCY